MSIPPLSLELQGNLEQFQQAIRNAQSVINTWAGNTSRAAGEVDRSLQTVGAALQANMQAMSREVSAIARSLAEPMARSAEQARTIARNLEAELDRYTRSGVDARLRQIRREAEEQERIINGLLISREERQELLAQNMQVQEARITATVRAESERQRQIAEAQAREEAELAERQAQQAAEAAERNRPINRIQTTLQPFQDAAIAFGAVSAAINVALGSAAKAYGEFEKTLNGVAAVSNATAQELDQIKQKSLEFGRDTQFSSLEAAQGFFELGKAGLNAQQEIEAMPGVLNLAAAGAIAVGDAAETTSGIINGFKLQMSEATNVADMLAQAANTSAIDVGDVAMSMKYIAPIAASSNQSLGEMTGVLAAMGNQMIKGEQAGTTMRSALVTLQKPSSDAAKEMHNLKISIQDTQGKMLPFSDIIAQLREKTKSMTETQRSAAVATIFGQESLSGMLALLNMAPGALEKMIAAQNNSAGASKQMADTMNQGLNFQLKMFKSSVETLAIKIGSDLAPVIGTLAKAMSDLTNAAAGVPQPIRAAAVAVTAFAGAVATLSAAVGAFNFALPTMAAGFRALTSGPVGLTILALGAIVTVAGVVTGAMANASREAKNAADSFKKQHESVKELGTRYEELSAKTKRTKAEEKERLEILSKLQEISPDLVSSYDKQGNATEVNRTKLKQYNDELQRQIDLEKEAARMSLKKNEADLASVDKKLAAASTRLNDIQSGKNGLKGPSIEGGSISVLDPNTGLPSASASDEEDILQEEIASLRRQRGPLAKAVKEGRDAVNGQKTTKIKTNRGAVVSEPTKTSNKSAEDQVEEAYQEKVGAAKDQLRLDLAVNDKKEGGFAGQAGAIRDYVEALKEITPVQGKLKEHQSEITENENKITQLLNQSAEATKKKAEENLKSKKDTYDLEMSKAGLEKDEVKRLLAEKSATDAYVKALEGKKGHEKESFDLQKKNQELSEKLAQIPIDERIKVANDRLEDQLVRNEQIGGGLKDEKILREENLATIEKEIASADFQKLSQEEKNKLLDEQKKKQNEINKITVKIPKDDEAKEKEAVEKFSKALGDLGVVAKDVAGYFGVDLENGIGKVFNGLGGLFNAGVQAANAISTLGAEAAVAIPKLIEMAATASINPYMAVAAAILAVVAAIQLLVNWQKQQAEAARKAREEAVDASVKAYEEEIQMGRHSMQEQIDFYKRIAAAAEASAETRKSALQKVYDLKKQEAEEFNDTVDDLTNALVDLAEAEEDYQKKLLDIKDQRDSAQLTFLQDLANAEKDASKNVGDLVQEFTDLQTQIDETGESLKAFDQDTEKQKQKILDEGVLVRKKSDSEEKQDKIAELEKARGDQRKDLEKQITKLQDDQAKIGIKTEKDKDGKTVIVNDSAGKPISLAGGDLAKAYDEQKRTADLIGKLLPEETAELQAIRADQSLQIEKEAAAYKAQKAAFDKAELRAKTEHDYRVDRDNAIILNLGYQLGLSQNQVDGLALLAKTLGVKATGDVGASLSLAEQIAAAVKQDVPKKEPEKVGQQAVVDTEKEAKIAKLQEEGKNWATAASFQRPADRDAFERKMIPLREQLRALGAIPQFSSGGLIPDLSNFDGLQATLHRGEMILPRDITQGLLAAIRGNQLAGVGPNINVTISGNYLHPGTDIRRLAREVSQEIGKNLRGRGLQ